MIWQTAALELGVCGWIIVSLIGDLLTPADRKTHLWVLAALGLAVMAGVWWWQQPWIGRSFDAMFTLDHFAYTFKGLFLLTTLIIVLMTRVYSRSLAANIGEFYVLIFSALLGMLVLASTNDLLLLFIGLELLTFSAYVMAAYLKTERRSVEAGLKYLILGSISSGFLIYGISLLYGTTGSTNFDVLRQAAMANHLSALTRAGLLLVLAGLGFKVAAVPFHLWVPDVYEGAPVPVVALLSVGSKMAGVMTILRVLYGVFMPTAALWSPVIAVAAAATILYGNLAALPQTNLKRLMGYSSIGHAGYLLMGVATGTIAGAQAVGVYLLAYLVSNLAVFFVITVTSQAVGGDSFDHYNGLARRSPLLAATLLIGLLSLAGVPPLAGFIGKLLVLLATVETHRLWLAAIGAVNVAVSLYYYMVVIRRVYVVPATSTQPIVVDRLTRTALIGLIIGIVVIGSFPAPFLHLFTTAIRF